MKTYAVDDKTLIELGVKDLSKFEGSKICIWWDKDTITQKVRDENDSNEDTRELTDEEIENIVNDIFDGLSFIDCSDINNEIEHIISKSIYKTLNGEENE
ncbi:MAG: hypothetical protein ACRCTZ_07905 [Sarcina sp.]